MRGHPESEIGAFKTACLAAWIDSLICWSLFAETNTVWNVLIVTLLLVLPEWISVEVRRLPCLIQADRYLLFIVIGEDYYTAAIFDETGF